MLTAVHYIEMNVLSIVFFGLLVLTVAFSEERKHHKRKKHAKKSSARQSADSLRVTTQNGVVEGIQASTVDTDKDYYAFHGIPYAQPPTGSRRFSPPSPASNWSGVYNATYERSVCVQTLYPSLQLVGEEDCLYINIYTPQLPTAANSTLLPVMVWIYGGAFIFGDGNYNSFGPDFLLDENVLVVTFNYRVGIFGFLSTEDLVVPGNYGLKDQILALKWVQGNIAAFGGNPRNVTIFGESAGAASVSYLVQSNLTAGLYERAIMQSGTVLCLWALSRTARKNAFDTGRKLGIFTNDSETLVKNLRNVPYLRLQIASAAISDTILAINPLQGLVLAPVIEPVHDGAVLDNGSYRLLLTGEYLKIPLLLGFNSEEGNGFSILISLFRPYLTTYDLTPTRLVPADFNNPNETVRSEVGQLIKTHYVGNGSFLGSEDRFVNYVSDDQFVRPIRQTVGFVSRYANTYYYQFSYEGNLGNPNRGNTHGVGHGEDLNYIFRINTSSASIDSDDARTRYRLVRLWTNFAKYGNPTPIRDPLLQNVTWPVASNASTLSYLNIDKQLTVQVNPHAYDMKFWTDLYDTYSLIPYDTY